MPYLSPDAWPFFPFEKIADTLENWLGDDEAAYRALRGVPWIATEKIHGANFCVVTDGVEIRCAKRKAYLAPDEDFFGHRALLDRLAPRILAVASSVRAKDARASLVFVYGELFGGAYPHPDVPADPAVRPVQTGCWYCPTIEFAAFDLGIVHECASERAYVDYDEAMRVFADAGLLCVEPLVRGSYEVVASFPLGFDSTVPAALGLPRLAVANKAEGVVMKPARAVTAPRRAGAIRPVIKRKIAEFAEDARFHGAEKWPSPPVTSGALDVLRYEVSALVTETRLAAAVSKVGRVTPGDTGRANEVLALLVDDLHAELALREAARLGELSPTEKVALHEWIAGEASALVELHLG